MARCPFYGCRWPEHTPELRYVGGSECGLDVEQHAACKMERDGRDVNFFSCPVADRHFTVLKTFDAFVRLPVNEEKISLEEWKRRFLAA